ncbi:MAG: S41 family peptidase [Gemmatimonadaceae bacterium]
MKTVVMVATASPSANLNAATFDSAWSIIARSHWDSTYNGVDWKAVRDSLRPRALKARNQEELRSVLTQMLGTLRQSHFSIIPSEIGEGLGGQGRDQSGDIGATIRDVDGAILVTAVRPGGAAERAGIRPGAAIQAVDGCVVAARQKVAGVQMDERRAKMTHWAAVTPLLSGPVGDTVRILARNGAGKLVVYAVKREAVGGMFTKVGNLPAMPARLETERRVVGGKNIGVIRFNVWMTVLSEGIRLAVDSLRGSDGIVLDLRGNVGGVVVMVNGVAGHFVDTALTLGTMIRKGGTTRYIINPQRVNAQNKRVTPFAGPLAIVVDELSISTTEIFAGGLQSLNRARVFGAQTAGEAFPAVAERLPNGDILYHAIASFLSPTGSPLEGVGVVPDVAVPITRSQLLNGRDPALEAAVSWAASSGKGSVRPH